MLSQDILMVSPSLSPIWLVSHWLISINIRYAWNIKIWRTFKWLLSSVVSGGGSSEVWLYPCSLFPNPKMMIAAWKEKWFVRQSQYSGESCVLSFAWFLFMLNHKPWNIRYMYIVYCNFMYASAIWFEWFWVLKEDLDPSGVGAFI